MSNTTKFTTLMNTTTKILSACVLILFLGGFKCFSQLDSISVSPAFEYVEIQDGDSTFQQKTISAQISIHDFDFLGSLLVTFYDVETNYPVDKQKYTRQELIDSELWNQGTAKISTYYVEENKSYRIEVIASNFQGLYLETVVTNLTVD